MDDRFTPLHNMNMRKEITQITFTLYFDIISVEIIYDKYIVIAFREGLFDKNRILSFNCMIPSILLHDMVSCF